MWFSFFGHRPRHAALSELNTDNCTLAKQGAAYTVDLDRHVITTTNLPKRDRFILAGFIWANAASLPFGANEPVPFAPIWCHGDRSVCTNKRKGLRTQMDTQPFSHECE
jgi:hypothetical protein